MYPVMGVCCIVFDIDGMLLKFCMNFLNIEKKNVRFVFNISYFLRVLCYFQHFQKKMVLLTQKLTEFPFFFRKPILSHFISCFMLFSTLQKN